MANKRHLKCIPHIPLALINTNLHWSHQSVSMLQCSLQLWWAQCWRPDTPAETEGSYRSLHAQKSPAWASPCAILSASAAPAALVECHRTDAHTVEKTALYLLCMILYYICTVNRNLDDKFFVHVCTNLGTTCALCAALEVQWSESIGGADAGVPQHWPLLLISRVRPRAMSQQARVRTHMLRDKPPTTTSEDRDDMSHVSLRMLKLHIFRFPTAFDQWITMTFPVMISG